MAYARKYKSRKSGARRPSRYAKRRAVAVPKKKKTPRSYTRSNAKQINTNARAIERLRMSQYGSVQRNFVQFSDVITVRDTRPILWNIMDFTKEESPTELGGLIYQQDAAAAVQAVGHWKTPPVLAGNPYHSGYNSDSVGTGKYLAMKATTVINVYGRPNLSDCRIRIQVFSMKAGNLIPNLTTQPQDNMVLPAALGALQYMATPVQGNYLPSNRFKTYVDKWIYINSSKTNASVKGTTRNSAYCSFTIAPKGGKLVLQQFTSPNVQGNPAADQDFGPLNIGLNEPLW